MAINKRVRLLRIDPNCRPENVNKTELNEKHIDVPKAANSPISGIEKLSENVLDRTPVSI